MSKTRYYRRKTSTIDFNTLTTFEYLPPKPYVEPVKAVISLFRSGIPFNKACDQVVLFYPQKINRNKLALHTLKTIANDN